LAANSNAINKQISQLIMIMMTGYWASRGNRITQIYLENGLYNG